MRCGTIILGILLSLGACNQKSSSSGARSTKSKTGSSGLSDASGTALPKSKDELVKLYLDLQSQIETMSPELSREQARRKNLMLDLMANIGAGCMGSIAVNTVEVIINGDKLVDYDVTTAKQTDQYLPKPTGQSQIVFTLGDVDDTTNSITFKNDETSNPVFATNGHLNYTIPEGGKSVKINSINMFSIKKSLPAYSVVDFCMGYDGTLQKEKDCSMQKSVKELERYSMKGVTVKVNGTTIYANGNARHIFAANPGPEDAKSQGLLWQENNVQLNDAYVALQQSTNCPTP